MSYEVGSKFQNSRLNTQLEGTDKLKKIFDSKLSGKEEHFNIYNYFTEIDKFDLFRYIGIIILVTIIINRIGASSTITMGVIIGIIIVVFLREKEISHGQNFDVEHEQKLSKSFMIKSKFFHMDADLIDFVDEIKEYRNYNEGSFIKMVKAIDNLLRIESDLEKGLDQPSYFYDIATDLQKAALNSLHSVIHSLPSTDATNTKHQKAMKKLHKLLSVHLGIINKLIVDANKGKGINIFTKFGYHEVGIPSSNDSYNPNYDFYT